MKKIGTTVLALLFNVLFLTAQVVTPAEEIIKSWELHKEMESSSIFKYLPWRSIGPISQGGRVESIAGVPGDPSIVYVGIGSGGVWRTENAGASWTPIFDEQPTVAIGDIEVSANNPDLIWVGTGESLLSKTSFPGIGVFKSIDGGETWEHKGLPDSHHIMRIAIDAKDSETVYVAAMGHNIAPNTERGVFKTTDGGNTWKKILYVNDQTGASDVIINPNNSNHIFAAMWNRKEGNHSGIYRSLDGGETWTKQSSGFLSGEHTGIIGFDIAPTNSNYVYAVVDNRAPNIVNGRERGVKGCEVYLSKDFGNTWEKTHEEPLYIYAGHGWSFGDIKVSPTNENEIFVLGVTLQKSIDGGKTFTEVRGEIAHLVENDSKILHLDMHDLWIDPLQPKRLLLGNDGGIFSSFDKGKEWVHHNNLPIAEFYTISIDNHDTNIVYGGTQDNSSLYGPIDNDRNRKDPWNFVWLDRWSGGDGFETFSDPTNPDIVFFESQGGGMVRKNHKINESVWIQPRNEDNEKPFRFNWHAPFMSSIHNPKILLSGGNKVFKSLDKGDNWQTISPDLFAEYSKENLEGVLTVLAESPLNTKLLIAGGNKSEIFLTTDEGENWINKNNGLPSHLKLTSIVPSKYSEDRVYITLNDYNHDDASPQVYVSNDLCDTWQLISNNLPTEATHIFAEDPKDENILYLGTDLGVYISIDRGNNWISLSKKLPPIATQDLLVHPDKDELIIATHGRSMYALDVRPIRKYRELQKAQKAYLFPVKDARLPRARHASGDWDLETSHPANFTFYTPKKEEISLIVKDKNGEDIWAFNESYDVGFHTISWDLVKQPSRTIKSAYFRGTTFHNTETYNVILKVGESTLNEKLVIKPFPKKE